MSWPRHLLKENYLRRTAIKSFGALELGGVNGKVTWSGNVPGGVFIATSPIYIYGDLGGLKTRG